MRHFLCLRAIVLLPVGALCLYVCVCVWVCVCVCLFVCVCASKCCQLLQSGKRKRNETVAGIAINHLCSSLALTHPNTHTHTHSCHTNAHTRSAVMLCTKWHKSTYTPTQTESEREWERGEGDALSGTCLQSYAELASVSQRNTQQKNCKLTRFASPPRHAMPPLLPHSLLGHTLL